jgi:glycosyltransferase involved in cell wall biosynthesis
MLLTGKKILICEEALIDTKGHYQTWIYAIRNMHLNAGAIVFVAGNRAVIPEVRNKLDVLPTYTVNSWDRSASGNWPSWRRYIRVLAQNWRVFWETRKALQQTGPVDMLFFTSARVHHLIGLRALCAWGLGRRFMRMTFFLLHSQAEYNEDYTQCRFPRQARLLARALRSFDALVKRGVVILAGDSHITCREYEDLGGVPFTLFPSPGASLKYKQIKERNRNRGPVFSILGVSAYHKGIDVFQDAILEFLKKFPDTRARFILQWSAPVETPGGKPIGIDPALRNASQVSLYEDVLSSEEYGRLFSQTDVLVLPYRKMTYFNRLSGVAVEAACSGKPMIVTENTWLQWALERFGVGLAVKEDDVMGLAKAIQELVVNFDTWCRKAEHRAAVASEYNSPEKYLALLWKNHAEIVGVTQ